MIKCVAFVMIYGISRILVTVHVFMDFILNLNKILISDTSLRFVFVTVCTTSGSVVTGSVGGDMYHAAQDSWTVLLHRAFRRWKGQKLSVFGACRHWRRAGCGLEGRAT